MKLWKFLAGATLYGAAVEALVRSRTPYTAFKRRFIAAEDGRRLALDEYAPSGKERGAVYLQHGLGARANTFDLYPHGPSFARWLAGRGWRVFLGSLRGRETGDSFDWKFSDYVFSDVPAFSRAVRSLSGGPFHWIGHSLGGILGLTHAARTGGDEFSSITTIGSALHYGVGKSDFSEINGKHGLREFLQGRKRVWNRTYHRLLAPWAAAGLLGGRALYNRANMSADALLAFHGHSMADITVAELFELATTFEGEGILCPGLEKRLPELVGDIPIRWLCIAGGADRQCPPDTARWTFDRVSSTKKQWLLAENYGHVDMVCGKQAAADVWTPIENFLAA